MIGKVGAAHVWFAVFVAVVFTAGLATGLLVSRVREPPPVAAGAAVRFLGGPTPTTLVAHMADDLELTAEQRQKLEAALHARRNRLVIVRHHLQEDLEREVGEVGAEIEDILTPDQQKRFQAFIARMQSRYLEPRLVVDEPPAQ